MTTASPRIPGIPRRQFLRGAALLGGALGVLPLLGACGDDASTGGGTALTIGVKDNPANGFDPYFRSTTAQSITRTLNSFLIWYDADLKPHGDAAESWKVSDDHRSIRMTLRDKLTFHSGAPVTTDDIVAGFKRGKDPAKGASLTASLSAIDSCTAVDKRTVEFTFAYAVPESLMLDTLNWFPVVEASKNTPEQMKAAPASCGPFKLTEYVSGERIVLERFDGYWDSGKPLVDKLTYQIFDAQDTEVSALKSGSLDGATVIPARLANDVKDQFTVVTSFPGAQVDVFQMNPRQAPWDNKKMRQAMARAIDRDRIVKEVRFGFSSPVVLPYPPAGPASDPKYLDKFAFDLDAARELWQEAGSPSGAEAAVPQNPETLALMQVIQSDLKKIGFDLQINQMDTTTYVQKVHAGDLSCVVAPVGNSLTTPSSISANYALSVTDNPWWGGDAPKEYAEAIEQANQALDADSQRAAWDHLNEVYMDLCWAPGVGLRQNIFPMNKNVTRFAVYPSDDFDMRSITRSS